MMVEARVTVRNIGLLLAQRGAQVACGILFVSLVPRLMGTQIYGRYALLVSLSLAFCLFSGLGFTYVMGRYIPQFVIQNDRSGLQRFFSALLTLRLVSGFLAAGFCLGLAVLWLRDLDKLVLLTVAGTVFLQALSNFFFAFFLGLNRAARWGMGTIIRQWASLALIVPGFYLAGLRGAWLGLILAELVVLGTGIWGIRAWVPWSSLRLGVRYRDPYVRFGLVFSAANLLLVAFQRSGETMVRAVSGDYAQVGYFSLANSIYLTGSLVLSQVTLASAPLLVNLLAEHRTEALTQWVERLLKWLAVGGVVAVFGVLLLGNELVPLVLGTAHRGVTRNLLPLAITLLPMGLISLANLQALIYARPGIALAGQAIQLTAFWALGPPLIAWQGSYGGCLAVLAASVLCAAYLTWRMRRVMAYSLQSWLLVIGLGIVLLPLVWLRASLPLNVALFAAFAAGYSGALYLLGLVTTDEAAGALHAIRLKGHLRRPVNARG